MIVVLFSQEKGLRDLCLPVTKFSPPFSFAARRQTNFSLDDAHHSIIVLYEKTCSRHSAPTAYSQRRHPSLPRPHRHAERARALHPYRRFQRFSGADREKQFFHSRRVAIVRQCSTWNIRIKNARRFSNRRAFRYDRLASFFSFPPFSGGRIWRASPKNTRARAPCRGRSRPAWRRRS